MTQAMSFLFPVIEGIASELEIDERAFVELAEKGDHGDHESNKEGAVVMAPGDSHSREVIIIGRFHGVEVFMPDFDEHQQDYRDKHFSHPESAEGYRSGGACEDIMENGHGVGYGLGAEENAAESDEDEDPYYLAHFCKEVFGEMEFRFAVPGGLSHLQDAVIGAPAEECEVCAVPNTAGQHCGEYIEIMASRAHPVATERDIYIICQPARQGGVPASPELPHGGGQIGLAEILHQSEAHAARRPDGDEGIAAEVGKDLK